MEKRNKTFQVDIVQNGMELAERVRQLQGSGSKITSIDLEHDKYVVVSYRLDKIMYSKTTPLVESTQQDQHKQLSVN